MGSLLLFAFACGGKVVVESTGPSGAGGSSTSSSSNGDGGFIASTGDVSPVGVVASSAATGGTSLCEQVCADQVAKGCDQGPDCVGGCQATYESAGMCTPQLDAFMQCLLTSSDTVCMNPDTCAGQLQAYNACTSPTMCNGTTSCSVTNDGSCDCQTDCNGAKLEVQCSPGNATDFCLCLKNGKPIDKCAQPQGTGLSCDIEKGCCAKVFFP
jgi:hypothetical protein